MAVLTPALVWRRYETDGVPDSGAHDPKKDEIIQLLDTLFGVSRGGWIVTKTKAALLAITPADETDGGVVLNDPTVANNGYYERVSGAWERGRGFPDTLALVTLAGTANAQTGTVAPGVNPSTVLEFIATPTVANTGPMTLSHTGETPKPVLNYAGNPLAAGEWATFVRYRNDGLGNYRLTMDANAASVATAQASAANTSRVLAEAARDAALAAIPSTFAATIAALKALDTTSTTNAYLTQDGREGRFKWKAGNYSTQIATDTAEGLYVKANAIASSAGAWVRIFEGQASVKWFGAVGNGIADDTAALQAAANTTKVLYFPKGKYLISATLNLLPNAHLEADNWFINSGDGATIQRDAIWVGPTLRFGQAAAGQTSGKPTMRNLQIEQVHTGFVPRVSTSISNRQTNDDAAHVEINGGSSGLFENNLFQYGKRHFDIKGGDNHLFRGNHHYGYWDEQTVALQETRSYYRVRNILTPFNLGFATSHKIENPQCWAAFTPDRNITIGSVTFFGHDHAGARFGFELYGYEDLTISGGYIGGCGNSNFLISPDGVICDSLSVSDMFMDGATNFDFFVVAEVAGAVCNTLHLNNIRSNGQQQGLSFLQVDKGVIANSVLYDLNIAGCSFENHAMAVMQLGAVTGALITGNIFTAYHNRGGGAGQPLFAAGAVVNSVSEEVHFRSNFFGGGTTTFGTTNNCQWPAYFSSPGKGSSLGDTSLLGLAGGADAGEWITHTPTVGAVAGTLTTASGATRYRVIDRVCHFSSTVTITTNGTGSNGVTMTLPVPPKADVRGTGRDDGVSGAGLQAYYIGGSLRIKKMDDTYPAVNGSVLKISGSYEVD